MNIELSPQAVEDLKEIGRYIARDNPRRGQSFSAEMKAHCLRLIDMPGQGVARGRISSDLRMVPYKNYLIFYRVNKTVLRIERFLHSARDIDFDNL